MQKEHISTDKLAHQLSISQRTLSNYINQLLTHFGGSISIIKDHHEISMIVLDESVFFNILQKLKNNISKSIHEVEAREESVFYYLLNNGVCTIDDIAEELYISKSIVNNTLIEIKNILKNYKVEIKGTQNVGLRIEGSEIEVRKVLIECFPNQYKSAILPDHINETLKIFKISLT